MDYLYIELQKIRMRPTMFLGEKSVECLYYFILGYSARAFQIDPHYEDCLSGFVEFVQKRYKDKDGIHHWKWLILNNSKNEEEAFDIFFELLSKYVKNKLQTDGTPYNFNAEKWYAECQMKYEALTEQEIRKYMEE